MKKYTKTLILLTVIVLLLSALPLSISAKNEYTQWTFSENDSVLSDGARTFKRYENAPPDLNVCSPVIFEYEELATLSNEEVTRISSFSRDSEIVWACINGYYVYYATEEGSAELDKFLSSKEGISPFYRFSNASDSRDSAVLDGETVSLFEKSEENTEINVRSLIGASRYEIQVQNENGTFAYTYATVFEKNGSFYYVAHEDLSNDRFDADGNISLRNGTLTVTVLDTVASEKLAAAIENIQYMPVTYIHEYDEGKTVDNTSALIIFWVIYIIIGFAAPTPLLALGLILPHSQKRGEPKHWYALAVIGALWIALALALAIVMLI